MLGSYEHVGTAIRGILTKFNWNIVSFMYHNHDEASGRGNSDCSFILSAISRRIEDKNRTSNQFDENLNNRQEFLRILTKVKNESRSEWPIFVVCFIFNLSSAKLYNLLILIIFIIYTH